MDTVVADVVCCRGKAKMLTVNLAEQRCFADICVIVRFVLETGIVLVGRYVTVLLFDAAVELEPLRHIVLSSCGSSGGEHFSASAINALYAASVSP